MIPAGGDEYERPPFSLLFIFLIVSLAILGQFLATILLVGLTGKSSLSLVGIGTILGYGTATLLAIPRIIPPPERWLGFLPPPPLAWLAALLLIPAVVIASELDNAIRALLEVPPPTDERPALEGFQIVEAAVLLIVVLPGVYEIFFRGILYPPLIALFGARTGVLVLGLISGFGLNSPAFSDPEQGPGAFLASLVQGITIAWLLGLLRYCSGSLAPGLFLSAAIGTISWLATLQVFGIPGFDDLSAAHTPFVWLAPAAASVGVGLGLCRALSARSDSAEGEGGREQSESEENRQ